MINSINESVGRDPVPPSWGEVNRACRTDVLALRRQRQARERGIARSVELKPGGGGGAGVWGCEVKAASWALISAELIKLH